MRPLTSAAILYFSFLLSLLFTSANYARNTEIVHYDLQFEILPSEERLLGESQMIVRLSFETENPFPSITSWCSLRLFAGTVTGEFPTQESVFLSGSAHPDNFAYWFVDPGGSAFAQEHLHSKGDANLRGYIGQHIKGKYGFGINLNAPLPFFPMAEVFADAGNTWSNDFGALKGDAGIGFNIQNLIRLDFPVVVSDPAPGENAFDFRWLIGVNF